MKWIFLMALAACNLSGKKPPAPKAVAGSFAVLELFTSEGCSSCPSADRLLPVLAAEDSSVLVLSFHVDYWDGLGWKDRFSQDACTGRQRTYAEKFHLESIYTPQLVVNGTKELVGSNRSAAEAGIKEALAEKPMVTIKTDAANVSGKEISVHCRLEGSLDNTQLFVALVQKHAETAVKGGENSGARLVHTNVVRSFTSKTAKADMQVALPFPDDIKNNWQLILFTQKNSDLKITGAASLNQDLGRF